jgi:hypothetical protein
MRLLISLLALLGLSGSSFAQSVNHRAVRSCASCHAAQSKPHPETSMAHALELVSECKILKDHPSLAFQKESYSYRMERKGDDTIYSVSDGQQTFTIPLRWAFGLGSAGQTYIYEKDGELYQSRVSFYTDIAGLDVTLGAQNAKPANLLQAAGQLMAHDEKVQCFRCHATDAAEGRELTLNKLIPGVQCERCHGSTESHLEGLKRGDTKLAHMNSLRALSTEQTSNFCGQCHRTWEEIAASGRLGVLSVRFQPYRLTNSKCYDADDKRISCTACHDPHQEVNKVDASYDGKCLACHSGGKPSAHACKTASSNCVSCHMPKIEIPGSHHKFSDHEIRIVKANAPYPD